MPYKLFRHPGIGLPKVLLRVVHMRFPGFGYVDATEDRMASPENHRLPNGVNPYAAYQWAFSATIVLRLVLGLIMAAAWLVAKPYIGTNYYKDPDIYGKLDMPTSFPGDVLLGVWPRWDAVHHLNLALRGYFDLSEGDSVFYPLYAICTRVIANLIGENFILAGLIVSTIATFVSLVGLYRLAEFYGTDTARWSILALVSYPTVLFLLAPFSESLFLALTLMAFIAFYRKQWWLGGLLGFFASLSRGPGMLNSFAFAIIVWQWWRKTHPVIIGSHCISIVAGLLLPIAGGLTFIVWRDAMGFASMATTLRLYSGLLITNPISGLSGALHQWLQVKDFATTIDILSAFIFIFLAGVMIVRAQWRRPEWIVYVVLNLCLFLSKQSLIASSLQSIPRYVLVLFPIFILIGDWLTHQGRLVRLIYMVGSSATLLIFSVLYTLWVFIA